MSMGFWQLQPYSLRLGGGVLVALLWLWWAAPRYGLHRVQSVGVVWAVLLGGLVGGRIGYAVGNPVYFAQHPWDLFRLARVGGLHGAGAWLGGLGAALCWTRREPGRWSAVLAWLTPAALAVAAGAWWGCAAAGCAWGRTVPRPAALVPWVSLSPDLYHDVTFRYAVQPVAALWALALIPFAVALKQQGGWAAVLYWVGAALLTGWRADPVPLLGGWRVDTWLDWGLALGLAGWLGVLARSRRKFSGDSGV